jgi:hypothetical protein
VGEERYDVVVLDLTLPDDGGAVLLEDLVEADSKIAVVVIAERVGRRGDRRELRRELWSTSRWSWMSSVAPFRSRWRRHTSATR